MAYRRLTVLLGSLSSLVVIIILTGALAFGQGVEQGSIAGVVRDTTGAVVPGANVVVKSAATGAERTSVSNNLGEYNVPGLTPGPYQVTVSKQGFQTYKANTEVTVGRTLTLDAQLGIGAAATTVEVTAPSIATVNTQTQEMSQLIDAQQVASLPSLTRNPYDFVSLAGNVSNGDTTSNGATTSMGGGGQELTSRGVGYAINGQRESGTGILLDGAENVAIFSLSVGNNIPVDGTQEYSIVTNNFGAEYGRAAGGVINVTTKSGTNDWHGSAWEFNRLAAYTANTYFNASNQLPKGEYTRNQFGFDIGGPIIKNKLFVSESTEWTRVRSQPIETEDIFDPSFISLLPANAQAYFNAFGMNHVPLSGTVVTAGQLTAAGVPFSGPGALLLNGVTQIPASQPVFDVVHFPAAFNAGGGPPQNTYTLVGRLDYNLSDKTQMFFRAARENNDLFFGTAFYSAYPQYDVGSQNLNQSYLYSINHEFSPDLFNNTKISFTRFNDGNSYNTAYQNVPNLMFFPNSDPVTSNPVSMPGLFNESIPGLGGLPAAGPQNTLQLEHDLSWTKGRHNMKFGGQFTYIQLNYAYGAYVQAVEQLGLSAATSMGDLINAAGNPGGSQLASLSTRISPQGALPCPFNVWGEFVGTTVAPGTSTYGNAGTNSCPSNSFLTPPVTTGSVARSYRYKDWAAYAQDSFKLTPRVTFNYGLRYEHYGVQHDNHQNLDSNFYYGPGAGIEQQVRNGLVQLATQSSVGQFWQPSWGTLAPRVGFAWDIFGDGRSSLRGGYGISYERNFGNVTYNASFNPPGSAVPNAVCPPLLSTCPTLVTTNGFGTLGVPGSATALPPAELRMPDPRIRVAQTQFWSLAVQRELARNTVFEVGYSGAHGVHLYDLENINQVGAGQQYLGDPIVTSNDPVTNQPCPYLNFATSLPECLTRPNPQYGAINLRGSRGISMYQGLNLKLQSQNLHNTGLSIVANYTWAKSLDDISSTFSDSLQGGSGVIGTLGYTDMMNPKLDWGPSDYDIRHRFVLSPIWQTPWYKGKKGWGEALGDWTVSGIFTARTGAPFNVYDYDNIEIGYTVPRLAPATVPNFQVSSSPQFAAFPGNNNVFNALTVPVPASLAPLNPVTGISDLGPFPANMTRRNSFRGPGAWNFDMAVGKNFKLTERIGLQFRAEGFNIFNHHNSYVNTTNLLYPTATGGPLEVTEMKGGLGSLATGLNNDERRFGQFSLHVIF